MASRIAYKRIWNDLHNSGEGDCNNCEGGIVIHCPALYDDVKEG